MVIQLFRKGIPLKKTWILSFYSFQKAREMAARRSQSRKWPSTLSSLRSSTMTSKVGIQEGAKWPHR